MADKMILVDTSVLIDYYRKTEQEKSFWLILVRQGYSFAISAVTKYEIYADATLLQIAFWEKVLQAVTVIPLDEPSVDTAVTLITLFRLCRCSPGAAVAGVITRNSYTNPKSKVLTP